MHEYSIVQSLLNLCEENAKKYNAKIITKVVVKIGRLSGVEPDLLKSAFDTFKEKTICQEAFFEMNLQDLVIICNSCQTKLTLKEYHFRCPKCKSVDIKVIDGEEMYLMSLEME